MDSRQHVHDVCEPNDVRVACDWCGRSVRVAAGADARASHGICERCARVLEGGFDVESLRNSDLSLSALEERTNRLMCHLYESSQMLLDIQQRVRHDGDLLGRVGRALAAIRRQERVVAEIQQWIVSAQG